MELPNLNDFVLNLLSDPTALEAFNLDPATVLDSAGLGDISAADVSEVVPLVVDLLPVQNTDVVDTALSSLSSIDGVAGGQAGAIEQLQNVTAVLSTVTTDAGAMSGGGALSLASPLGDVTGALTANAGGLELAGVAGPMSADLSASSDVADVLDSGAMTVDAQAMSAIDTVTGAASGVTAEVPGLDTVTSAISYEAGIVNQYTMGAVQWTAGALANPSVLADVVTNPGPNVASLSNTLSAAAEYAAAPLAAAPGGDVVVGVIDTGAQMLNSAVSEASSHLNPGAVSDVASHATDPSYLVGTAQGAVGTVSDTVHAVAGQVPGGTAVTGVTDTVTGALSDPTHALSTVTGALSDPSHALSTVTDTAAGAASTVTGATDTLSHVTSGTPLAGITSTVAGVTHTVTDTATHAADPSADGHASAGLLGDIHL